MAFESDTKISVIAPLFKSLVYLLVQWRSITENAGVCSYPQ